MDKLFQFKAGSDGANTKTSQQSQQDVGFRQGFGGINAQSDEQLFGKREYEPEEGEYDSTMKLPVKNHMQKLEV